MPDQSTQSIVIDADPADVMAVIADFAAHGGDSELVRKLGSR